ncbi:Protein phosphatase 1 regulatory subunit 7 [Linum grandiflorum]
MVRFSCFNAHIHSHKSKTTVEQSMEAMLKALQDSSKVQDVKTSAQDTSLNSVFLRSKTDTRIDYGKKEAEDGMASEQVLDSEEIGVDADAGICHATLLKRSKSLGNELCHEGLVDYNNTEVETDQGGSSDSPDHNSGKEREGSPTSQYDKAPVSESVQVGSDIVNNGSVFSAGDSHHSNKEVPESSDIQLFGDAADNSGLPSPPAPTKPERSRSFPNLTSASLMCGAHTRKSKSSDDLRGLDIGWKDLPVHEVGTQFIHDKEINDCRSEGNNFENPPDDVYDSYDYSSPAKDWVMPVADEEENLAEEQLKGGGSSTQQPGEYPNEDFRFRRIEAWVNDLHSCGPVDEVVVLPGIDELVSTESTVLGRPTVAKVDDKMTPSMEAAKRYISSLSPSATTAQLSNHGLAVIPALGAFGSLRVLNLSGNSIARITAGVLPRGLHMLNLAKNNISTIEGLRELTRLRVLDLSYNRIFRIGHGLGSCSSLKELYLAGNKISEVEGLHRLLKLTVLDLRFNKLSTTKCLGQLAANYSSLQAISLEGNPAQKNVGDEQLKKHLQGLLPHLVYFNRQATKAGTLKDAADRSVRLGIRSDNKSVRKAGHGLTASRALSSSTHGGRASTSSPKRSKGKHVKLPPSGISRPSMAARPVQGLDLGGRVVDFRAELAMRRSKSEGNMGPQGN